MKLNVLNEMFKDAYIEPSGLDSTKTLSWYMDDINTRVHRNRKMSIFKVTYRQFGWAHNADNWCWGPENTFEMHEDELKKYTNSPSTYVIKKAVFLRRTFHHAIIAKITPQGERINTPAENIFWHEGRKPKIEKPEPIRLIK